MVLNHGTGSKDPKFCQVVAVDSDFGVFTRAWCMATWMVKEGDLGSWQTTKKLRIDRCLKLEVNLNIYNLASFLSMMIHLTIKKNGENRDTPYLLTYGETGLPDLVVSKMLGICFRQMD